MKKKIKFLKKAGLNCNKLNLMGHPVCNCILKNSIVMMKDLRGKRESRTQLTSRLSYPSMRICISVFLMVINIDVRWRPLQIEVQLTFLTHVIYYLSNTILLSCINYIVLYKIKLVGDFSTDLQTSNTLFTSGIKFMKFLF